jgi:hypothetical protein
MIGNRIELIQQESLLFQKPQQQITSDANAHGPLQPILGHSIEPSTTRIGCIGCSCAAYATGASARIAVLTRAAGGASGAIRRTRASSGHGGM